MQRQVTLPVQRVWHGLIGILEIVRRSLLVVLESAYLGKDTGESRADTQGNQADLFRLLEIVKELVSD